MKRISLLLLTIIFFTTGCNYRELDDLAIGSTIGIDYKDNKYVVTVQVLGLKKEGESNESESAIIYKATGDTIPSAIRNISLRNPKELYLGHLELVILGKDMLNSDLQTLFDYFVRNPETGNDFQVLIAPNNTANEILEPKDGVEETFPSDEIINSITNSMKRNGTTVEIKIEELISKYLQKGIDPVSTTIEPNKENDKFELTGIIAFNNENKIKLSRNEAIAYNIFYENFVDIDISTTYKDSNVDLVILEPKTKIKANINDNKIDFTINVSLTAQVSEIQEEINLEDHKYQEELTNILNKTIKEYIESLLNTCKENNLDILGLKNFIYKKHTKYYNNYKDSNIYEIANIDVNVDSNVFRYGNIYRSTKGE